MQVATSEEVDEPGDAMDTSPSAPEEPPTPMRKRLMERLGSEALTTANGLIAAAGGGLPPTQASACHGGDASRVLPAAMAVDAAAEPAPAPKALLPAPVRPLLTASEACACAAGLAV